MDFSEKQRKHLAKTGAAESDGSYPIRNRQDLLNAIKAYGRSKNKAKTKAHIISRAKSLGLTSLLPDDWKKTTHLSAVDTLISQVTSLDKDDLCLVAYLSAQQYKESLVELSKGRLDRSPKHNWVEDAGGLPGPIEDLAVELHKKGMSISHAIATAVSRAKVYAVTANGAKKAKWAAAVARWEAMKASSKLKSAAKAIDGK